MGSLTGSLTGSVMDSVTGSLGNGAVSLINAYITEKQVVEDDILFTNPLAKKGITSQHV